MLQGKCQPRTRQDNPLTVQRMGATTPDPFFPDEKTVVSNIESTFADEEALDVVCV